MLETKKSNIPRSVAVIGALTALLAAATPGIIGLLDTTAAIAKAKAEASAKSAEKSEGMANLGYDLLKYKLENTEVRLSQLEMKIEVLLKVTSDLSKQRSASSRRPSAGVDTEAIARAMQESAAALEGGGGASEESLMSPSDLPEAQKELPASLEAEWVKSKKAKKE